MELSSKIAMAISFVYVSISYLVLLNSIVSVDETSMFYLLDTRDFFLPGYFLGFILGFIGRHGFLLLGQVVTFILFFLGVRNVVKGRHNNCAQEQKIGSTGLTNFVQVP